MRARVLCLALVGTPLLACGGGPPAPPALAYRLPDRPEAAYVVADTAVISIDAMGQSIALEMGSLARYAVAFARADEGLAVTLSVADLDATLTVPMAGPVTFDESTVDGDLRFTLDRRGEVSVTSAPNVDEMARQFMPPDQLAHSFFPALPGTAVAVGDAWSDTVAVESADAGSLRNVLTYTVVGDTAVAGRSLLHIRVDGTSQVTQRLEMQGTAVEQTTNLTISGHVLWDLRGGVMYERATEMTGTGSVQTPLIPGRLPTRFEMRSTAHLVPE